MEKLIDLHVHSDCSDGTFTPEELTAYALKKNLHAFALTDHDTTAGIQRALKAASGTSLTVIPGIELSTEYQGRDVHILGLGIWPDSPVFQNFLTQFQEARILRNQKMCRKLQECGVEITYEELLEAFPGRVLTRAHFARYLMDHGYVKSMAEAFPRYIGDHAPCYVPKERISPAQAVELILKGHGHPVLAHPLLYHLSRSQLEELVRQLTALGLQGLEAIYSTNRGCDTSSMKRLAGKYDLSVTGGSDFHGSNKPDIDLGCGKGN